MEVVVIEARGHGRRSEPLAPGAVGVPQSGDPLEAFGAGPQGARRVERLVEPARHHGRAHVAHAQPQQLGGVRREGALQLPVARQDVAERAEQRLSAKLLAERAPAVGQQHPAALGVEAERREDMLGRDALEHRVEAGLEGGVRPRRLEVHVAVRRRRPQHRRPRACAELLERARARDPRLGEPRVHPRRPGLGDPAGIRHAARSAATDPIYVRARRRSAGPPAAPGGEMRRPGGSIGRLRRARSSVGERSLHTREVAGSKPAAPMSPNPRCAEECRRPAAGRGRDGGACGSDLEAAAVLSVA
jgi:hypothetical protein